MDSESADTSSQHTVKAADIKSSSSNASKQESSASNSSSKETTSSISSWARKLKVPLHLVQAEENSQTGNEGKSTFSRLVSGLGLNLAEKTSLPNENTGSITAASTTVVLESFTKGLVDSSLNAVKAVQVKARHVVSQNKRRYQMSNINEIDTEMDNETRNETYNPAIDPKNKAKSKDPGWQYAYWPNPNNKNKVKCTLCQMTITGGIKRLKQHLVGGYSDVIKCPKTTTEIASVMESYLQAHKRTKLITLDDYCQSLGVGLGSEEHSSPTPPSTTSTSKRLRCDIPRPKGQPTIDSKLRRTPEEIVDERRFKESIQTTIENRMKTVEDRDRVLKHISNWFYEYGIPFNTVKARSFEVIVESIAQYGSGLQPPYHELRVPLLEKAKKKTDELKKAHQATWKQYGCSLMSDGWTDKRGRHLINFLVNSPKGSFFLGSVDASSGVQDAKMLFNLLDNKIEEIGPENVVQEGGFDLDMTYITDNIIAMGFPAGDMSSGFFAYFEGLYRNHMEEVIKFFETHHKGKYKVYNLCSERLYDASLFEGKVASFPFDDHNCPPIHLIPLFCRSAYSWLKEDILNVVAVHCKAGKARTGVMICSLLLFLKFFPTAQECIDYYNQKRCVDAKGLILPSQIRYVKYYERILTNYGGDNPPGRRCMLRGFRLHACPYWIRPSITLYDHNGILFTTKKHPKTKDLMPEDFWIRSPRKGIVVFALPGEPGLTELKGDFKILFQDRQGDFYCWLNTTMIQNRTILDSDDLDDFDKRKFPAPGFKVELVMIDYDGTIPARQKDHNRRGSNQSLNNSSTTNGSDANSTQSKVSRNQENDDVFSDSDGDAAESSGRSLSKVNSETGSATTVASGKTEDQIASLKKGTEKLSLETKEPSNIDTSNEIYSEKLGSSIPNLGSGDIKAIAADASVFTFGDDEDYESE